MANTAVEDVDVEISVVLGKATMPINQLLKMGRGAVIELNAKLDDHAWIFANNKLIARGEIVVSGENVAISITETVNQ
ncbi:FliM/FliN family flagellar motor switch protein [Marinibaculum pumilum]|uniref:Flagellar motor switch protein FliN n=1 Tax=Marinibaculum pumilum TaxID=1766165 RepID=A0ABV7KZ49_9PROT